MHCHLWSPRGGVRRDPLPNTSWSSAWWGFGWCAHHPPPGMSPRAAWPLACYATGGGGEPTMKLKRTSHEERHLLPISSNSLETQAIVWFSASTTNREGSPASLLSRGWVSPLSTTTPLHLFYSTSKSLNTPEGRPERQIPKSYH